MYCRKSYLHSRRLRHRRSEKGASIVESMLSMLVIFLILFGLLQIFHLSLARAVADYAAFRGARSAAVGFRDSLANREARVFSIPASGLMTYPRKSQEFGTQQEQFAFEQTAVERYMDGTEWLDYEYWDGTFERHRNPDCPLYGQELHGANCPKCQRYGKQPQVTSDKVGRTKETVEYTFRFLDYPLDLPMRKAITRQTNTDIKSEVKLTNHSSSFLE